MFKVTQEVSWWRQDLKSFLSEFNVHNLNPSAEKPLEGNRKIDLQKPVLTGHFKGRELELLLHSFNQSWDLGLPRKITSARCKTFFPWVSVPFHYSELESNSFSSHDTRNLAGGCEWPFLYYKPNSCSHLHSRWKFIFKKVVAHKERIWNNDNCKKEDNYIHEKWTGKWYIIFLSKTCCSIKKWYI